MAKKIKVDILSPSSLQKCIDELKAYRNSLDNKCQRVVKRLTEEALRIISMKIAEAAITVETTSSGAEIESGQNFAGKPTVAYENTSKSSKAVISVAGEDIIFIEFGAGVYYNGTAGISPHPKGEVFNFVIGGYGKGKGVNKVWGYYGEDGELHLTHGVKATMPMYSTIMEITRLAPIICKEVFGGK